MRKKEEELFMGKDGKIDRKAWVKYHRFPEDKINDWFEQRSIKTTKQYHDTHQRCRICNYSSSKLHDAAYVASTGKLRKRSMFKDGHDWLCQYCYNPNAQYKEILAYEAAIAEYEHIDEFKRAKKYIKEQQSEKETV